MRGSLTISRPRGGGAEHVEIRMTDEMSGTVFVEAQIGLSDFTEALVGLSNVPCEFQPRFDYVGMRYEHKDENVPYNGEHYADPDKRERIARKTFKRFETDGWRGRTSDLFNHHRRTEDGYMVTFTRYVAEESQ